MVFLVFGYRSQFDGSAQQFSINLASKSVIRHLSRSGISSSSLDRRAAAWNHTLTFELAHPITVFRSGRRMA